MGGDGKIAALKTASFEGTYRRIKGEQDMTGDLELYFAAPDKFQRVEQFSFGPNPGPRIAQTVNGTEGWMGPLGPVPGGMAFRFGGPGGPGGPGGQGGNRAAPGGPGGPGGQRFDPGIIAKQLYWRTALAMFPGTEATSALSFTYVGKAESPDGEADVLDVKGEGNFKARLFVDAKTHLPVMLTYQDRERRMIRQTAAQPGRDRRAVPRPHPRRARSRRAAAAAQDDRHLDVHHRPQGRRRREGAAPLHDADRRQADRGMGTEEGQGQPEARRRAVQAEDEQLIPKSEHPS